MGYSSTQPRQVPPQNGAIGSIPTPSDITAADANILALPLSGTSVDVTANHVFNAGTFASAGYNGESILDTAVGASLTASSGTAHRIPSANPVSFGGMFRFVNPPQAATPYIISSAVSGGVGNHNYSMVFVTGSLNLQTGAGTLRDFGWTPQSDPASTTPGSTGWVHIIMELDANRTSGRLYLNGKQFGADQVGLTVGAPGGSDGLFVAGIGGAAPGELLSYCKNAFIRDSLLGATEARRLAEESFGHGLPA